MNKTPIVHVSRDSPRITVTMKWSDIQPQGQILLYMKRVGERAEFAAYPPLGVNGSELLFEFDDLLFVKKQGRYEGRLMIGPTDYGRVQVQYEDNTRILAVEK